MSSASSETPSIKSILEKLDSEMFPIYKSIDLSRNHENGHSLRMTLMKEAWESSGVDPDDPGSVNQYYLEDLDLLIVDLDQKRQRR